MDWGSRTSRPMRVRDASLRKASKKFDVDGSDISLEKSREAFGDV